MDTILTQAFSRLPVLMMVGIIGIIAVSRIHRPLGSMLGVMFWLGVAMVGHHGYVEGHSVGFPGIQLPSSAFYGMCAIFVLINLATGWTAWRNQKRAPVSDDND